MILTTPGRDYRVQISEIEYPVPAIGDEDLHVPDLRRSHCHIEDVEAEEQSEELARAREHAAWISLQEAVQSLPLELNLLIRDTMLEELFGPGKEIVYPYKGPAYVQHFRALDRHLYNTYSHIYYCRNMWVIEEGSESGLLRYNHSIAPEIPSKIKNLTLRWTWRDALDIDPVRRNIQDYIDREMEAAGAGGFDNLKVLRDFDTTCYEVECELEHIWFRKSYEIGCMQLDYLVIDAREAFAPDGKFLGLEAARWWAESSQPPPHLDTWAPNDDENLAEQIFDLVIARYS